MKKVVMMMTVLFFGATGLVMAQKDSTTSFKVLGNCGMCKARIEKAAKAGGATKATWAVDAQTLTVSFSPKATSSDKIQQKVAAAGHDTPKYKSLDASYDKLPGCCQYDRDGTAPESH